MGEIFPSPVVIEGEDAPGRAVLVCEHADNSFPEIYGNPGIGDEGRRAHVAWDPGALGLARALAARLQSPLVRATLSRLIYDLNRPPGAESATPPRSEIYDIPFNHALAPPEKLRRVSQIYLPFHDALHGLLAQRMAAGQSPVLITVHSFTPIFEGRQRDTEFGIIHDQDDRLAKALARQDLGGLAVHLNQPYSAADGVAHTLALHATPYGLSHAMLEIRNDLIADEPAQAAMADRLAPAIIAAMKEAA
ncbi:MAG: N-formylglutamate amidohydrolase [Paracoccus sp. (in: a-proteobacteria)]|nr:N-formylglutamate amidohydrolase [Paracoccus sp. (in: a-proteobacteria)]